ncbi:MAG: SH3 domain-containing protein [Mogibacterium sp.]|nr:SH3 domain-containing protein [Mogibacterium sp.]
MIRIKTRHRILNILVIAMLVTTTFNFVSTKSEAASGIDASGVVKCKDGAILRSKASTKGERRAVLKYGTPLIIRKEVFTSESKNGATKKWYRVTSTKGSGFIRSDLVKIKTYGSATAKSNNIVIYRKGAGNKMKKVGQLKKNSSFIAVMEAKAKGSTTPWYKVKVNLKYCYVKGSGISLSNIQSGAQPLPEEPEEEEIVQSPASAAVASGACTWAIAIANDNSFHYGNGKHAHHNGCYFCGTQPKSKQKHVVQWEKTYCCNPFVHAAYAHGGGDATMLSMCQNGRSYDWDTIKKSSLFIALGHPDKSTLLPGDVLCWDGHMAMYIGNGQYVDAGIEDKGDPDSQVWDDSIAVRTLTDKAYKSFKKVYRYVGAN